MRIALLLLLFASCSSSPRATQTGNCAPAEPILTTLRSLELKAAMRNLSRVDAEGKWHVPVLFRTSDASIFEDADIREGIKCQQVLLYDEHEVLRQIVIARAVSSRGDARRFADEVIMAVAPSEYEFVSEAGPDDLRMYRWTMYPGYAFRQLGVDVDVKEFESATRVRVTISFFGRRMDEDSIRPVHLR